MDLTWWRWAFLLAMVFPAIPAAAGDFPAAVWVGTEGQDLFGGSNSKAEVLGISKDNRHYAIRRLVTDDKGQCKYPKVGGKKPLILTLALCEMGKPCTKEWPIYGLQADGIGPVSEGSAVMHATGEGCRSLKEAKKSLKKAKTAILKAGVQLGSGHTPVKIVEGGNGFTLFPRQTKSNGLEGPMKVRVDQTVQKTKTTWNVETLISFSGEGHPTIDRSIQKARVPPKSKVGKTVIHHASLSKDGAWLLIWLKTPEGLEAQPRALSITGVVEDIEAAGD